MPEMTGIESTKHIRAEIEPAKQPQIIALTAEAFEENRKKCFQAGMNKVLTKPINKSELAKYLSQCPKKDL